MIKGAFRNVAVALALGASLAVGAELGSMVDAGEPFGQLRLIDEVLCGQDDAGHEFTESPEGISEVQTILGEAVRVLPTEGEPKFFAYRLGAGKGLESGKAYVLTVEFPEDAPRSMFIANRGGEITRGVQTGTALGDTIFGYTGNNLESLQIPLSGRFETYTSFFHLHDNLSGITVERSNEPRPNRAEDGFWVVIAQAEHKNYPLSQGAAVWRIRLFEAPSFDEYTLPLNLPPDGLPQRHLFFREEMADSAFHDRVPATNNRVDWYEFKVRMQKMLGMNTFTKDLLEFGHNQGWDSGSPDTWYYASSTPEAWSDILDVVARYDMNVLPYYEYAGGPGPTGVGTQRLALPLRGELPYTHIQWSERHYANILEPATLDEATRLLEATITRYNDRVNFIGAIFRPRPSHMPMSFRDEDLAMFVDETGRDRPVTRQQLRQSGQLLKEYYDWWFAKRQDFFVSLAQYLRENSNPDAFFAYHAYSGEPVPELRVPGKPVVTDDVPTWQRLAGQAPFSEANLTPVAFNRVLRNHLYADAVLAPHGTWGEWEWHHSLPQADPQNYHQTEGVLMGLPINSAYTVADPELFETFELPAGTLMFRHFPLNENVMADKLGYFVCDMERTGPYSMLPEAWAMANGNPTHIGYLAGDSFSRSFPQYVRNFNQAYLALPALPSERRDQLSSDEQVVVRVIETPASGTYLAVVNTALTDKTDVVITLPAEGELIDAATGEPMQADGGKVTLSFYPCQLRALRVK